jgi:heme exporter protein A
MSTLANPVSPSRLRIEQLECRRGERTLFRGLDVAIEAGEIVWIRGANGQGKTTLLRTIAGLSAADSGRIAWSEPPAPGRMLYLAHANALKEDLTVGESLRFLLGLTGAVPSAAAADAALARFGMAGRRDAPVRTLSQGQRRRVALARLAMPTTPSLWLLDEPFDALDTAGTQTLNEVLVEQARRGGSVVLTSHLPLGIVDPTPREITLSSPVAP